jgi:hypothetical protein
MDKVSFLVQGSAAEPYEVIFKLRDDKNLSAYYTCQAGSKGTHCKHRINILRGETRGIVEGDLNDVKKVLSWLPGTDVEAAIKEIENAEDALVLAKSNLARAKKKLGQALLD